jgi:23S rRNA (uracil1939-C5)-methyltransferase
VLLDVVSPAPDAVAPRCGVFGLCGGCQWQQVPLERQRAEKHRALAALLAPLGGDDLGIVGDDGYGYRNKVELSFGAARYLPREEQAAGAERAGRFLGMHAPGRFDRIVDAPRCELITERANAVLARVRHDALGSTFPLWDPHSHTGFFRHLALREGRDGVVLSLHTSPGGPDHEEWIRAHAPGWGAAGVLWVESDRPADVAAGNLREVVFGTDHVRERLAGVEIRLSPSAFFQVNPLGAERLVQEVGARLGGGGTLVDLYCGTGALGLANAHRFDRVVGIEVNAAAVRDAEMNAAANRIPAQFFAGEVEASLEALADVWASRPAVIVDPPRVGLHPRALETLSALDLSVLVYVACRPSSLLRDGLALMERGWRCVDRVAVDLFPQTGHVEVVSRWVRA